MSPTMTGLLTTMKTMVGTTMKTMVGTTMKMMVETTMKTMVRRANKIRQVLGLSGQVRIYFWTGGNI